MLIGQYSFPFSFVLQESIPGSFKYQDSTNNIEAEVTYELKADLTSSNVKVAPHLLSTQFLTVQQVLFGTLRSVEKTVNVKGFCGLLSKGSSKMKGKCDKPINVSGESVRLILEVDNSQCGASVTNMKCELHQTIILRDSQRNETKIGPKLIATKQLEGLRPGETWMDLRSKIVEIPLLKTNVGSGELPASSKGELVDCSYCVKVSALVTGCSVSVDQDYEIELGVNVGKAAMEYGKPNLPTAWNPQEAPKLDLIVSNAYKYDDVDKDKIEY